MKGVKVIIENDEMVCSWGKKKLMMGHERAREEPGEHQGGKCRIEWRKDEEKKTKNERHAQNKPSAYRRRGRQKSLKQEKKKSVNTPVPMQPRTKRSVKRTRTSSVQRSKAMF